MAMLSPISYRRIFFALAVITGMTCFGILMSKLAPFVMFGAVCMVLIIAMVIGLTIKTRKERMEL